MELGNGGQVCKCWSQAGGDFSLTLEQGGKVVNEWRAEVRSTATAGNLEVLVGDISGDGRAEVIVASLEAVSNGMAVPLYEVAILDGSALEKPPVRFRVQEFGAEDNFVYSPARRACEVLATSWEDGRDQQRGWGLYLVGQWYRYEGRSLVPDSSRPVLARRYLNSLKNGRDASPNRPFRWLRHRSTVESWSFPPSFLGLSLENTETGEVVHVSGERVEFRAARGFTRQLDSLAQPVFESDPVVQDSRTVYWLLADETSGRLYPHGYVPSDPDREFAGRRATEFTYRSSDGGRFRVISIGK